MYDVVIIGAGVTGAMTARELSRFNLSVCILEKENDVAMGATKANSAIVHAGFDAKVDSKKAEMNVKGSEMMETVAKELGVKYKRNGSLVVAYDDEQAETIKELYERGIKNGVQDLEIIDSDEIKRKEPNISDKAVLALWAPTGAIICPYELTIAAVGNAMDNGVELIRNFEVKSINKENDVFVISSDNEEVEARYVVNAAGLFADDIAAMVGDNSFNIHPRKGEYMLLDKENAGFVNTTVFGVPSKKGKGILVSPTVDNNIILGPTAVDMEDKTNKETTIEGLDSVMSSALECFPTVPLRSVITSFTGLRAVGDSGDFIIEESKACKNFINAAGIESPGLSSAPAIAEYIRDLLKDSGLVLEEKEDFNPIREHKYRDASEEEKNEMIKKNSKYGRIICRCEGISEGEILDALRQNPKALDLDSVKRRTRSGMGKCQGGFCTPYITDIISKELGISPYEVTKFGKGSNLLVEK